MRSSPLRSPLAILDDNRHQQQQQQQQSPPYLQFSNGAGATTRAVSRKLRRLFEYDDKNSTPSMKSAVANNRPDAVTDEDRDHGSTIADPSRTTTTTATKKKKSTKKKTVVSGRKSSKNKKQQPTARGRWQTWERFEFLKGLRRHGRGHWKIIGESIPTRYVCSNCSSSFLIHCRFVSSHQFF